MRVNGTAVAGAGRALCREIFPAAGAHQFQLRFRAPAGTKFELTEVLARDVLDEIKNAAGPGNVETTLGYVGVQPSSYPINTIFLWTGGSHEGVLQVALRPVAGIRLVDFEETLRGRFKTRFPAAQFSFEPGAIVNRLMNFCTCTPFMVDNTRPDFAATLTFAADVEERVARIPAHRRRRRSARDNNRCGFRVENRAEARIPEPPAGIKIRTVPVKQLTQPSVAVI